MSSTGSVQLLNIQNKPLLFSLSTRQGKQCDSTLSDVTWQMQETVTAVDDNFTAIANVDSMVFYNAFANISAANNKLKILSTYNVGSTPATPNTITVTVPPGHYDINSLLVSINSQCNSRPGGTFYYGMGVNANNTYPGFIISTVDPSKITFSPPTAGVGGALSTWDTNHIYTGFYLIYDSDTKGLMDTLGLVEYNQSNQPINIFPVDAYQCLGFNVFTGGSGTTYSFTTPWVAPSVLLTTSATGLNCIDLGGPNALSISWEAIYASTRNSFENLKSGDTIAIVPIVGAYGYKTIWEPSSPFKCIIPNFNINQFRIIVKNADTGELVDFQGNNWLINLRIEFCEIDNTYKSEMARAGNNRNVLPNMHNTVYDHTLPFSGTSGHKRPKHGSY